MSFSADLTIVDVYLKLYFRDVDILFAKASKIWCDTRVRRSAQYIAEPLYQLHKVVEGNSILRTTAVDKSGEIKVNWQLLLELSITPYLASLMSASLFWIRKFLHQFRHFCFAVALKGGGTLN